MYPTKYFSSINHAQIAVAPTFTKLSLVAQDVLANMPEGNIHQVCGAISTGSRTVQENLAIFDKTIATLFKSPLLIFNQIPFEKKLEDLKKEWDKKNPGGGYCKPILTKFYLPLFKSGRIKTLIFLPGWKESFGARWEHEKAKRLGINIIYLPQDWTSHYDLVQVPEFKLLVA